MAKRKIAILGGGVASLTAAYYLTRTEALRAKHQVTVYQIGWRLGGKGSTGRSNGRIEEHGLHVWFGYYDNAFRMLREVFRDWEREPDQPLKSWHDALKPQSFTPIGPEFFPLNWPTNDAVPGDGHLNWTSWQAYSQVLGTIAAILRTWHEGREQEGRLHRSPIAVPDHLLRQLREAHPEVVANSDWFSSNGFTNAHHAIAAAAGWARSLGATHHGQSEHHLPGILELLSHTGNGFRESLPNTHGDGEAEVVHQAIDIFLGFSRGFVHDFLIAGKTAREVDANEFRDWLVAHGTSRDIATDSVVTRALYDTMFQYEEGDSKRPNYAAGTSVQVILRLFGCSKGAALWEMQAGMGEVIVAPMYQLLLARGVDFEFFSDVQRLGLDDSGKRVAQIVINRQAETLSQRYQPTFKIRGLDCWPAQPFWEQLKDGARLREAGVDFESPWSVFQPVRTDSLKRGVDFDEIVLGISLGAFKRLNDDPTMVDELTVINPRFRSMTEQLGLVPSMALQIWSSRSLTSLGWQLPKPAAVAGVEPLDIWADMSQTLAFEEASDPIKPKSVHYFTGVMSTQAYRNPRSAHNTQHEGEVALTRICADWLQSQGPRIWPAAINSEQHFDWNALLSGDSLHGSHRLQAQFIRANISPTECCVGSPAGSTKFRLKAGESGFDNLILAGCWIDTGFNTTCIEAAVMSGMQASRAVCGEPAYVIGEDLLQRPGHGLGMLREPLHLVEEVAHFVEESVDRLRHWLSDEHRQPQQRKGQKRGGSQ